MASNVGWNKNVPSGFSSIALGDDEFRSIKSFMQAWWEQEHYATDGSANSAGVHKPGSARAYVGTNSQLSNPETGRLFWTTDEARLYVGSESGWSQLPALGSVNTWTATQEFANSASSHAIRVHLAGESQPRLGFLNSGIIEFGPGNALPDVVLYRSGPDRLKTDDAFEASEISTVVIRAQALDIPGLNSELSATTIRADDLVVGNQGVVITNLVQGYVIFEVDQEISPGNHDSRATYLPGSGITIGDYVLVSGNQEFGVNYEASISTSQAEAVIVRRRNVSGSTMTVPSEIVKILVIKTN